MALDPTSPNPAVAPASTVAPPASGGAGFSARIASSTSVASSTAVEGAEDAEQPQRVLVVEGDIEVADLIVSVLENAGYKIEIATDGQYALMLLDSFEPDLILLGLAMPGLSGLDVTQILRGDPRYAQRFRSTRIFYLTDRDHMVQKRFTSLPGTPMSDYIFKPIDIPELLEKVRRAFDNTPA